MPGWMLKDALNTVNAADGSDRTDQRQIQDYAKRVDTVFTDRNLDVMVFPGGLTTQDSYAHSIAASGRYPCVRLGTLCAISRLADVRVRSRLHNSAMDSRTASSSWVVTARIRRCCEQCESSDGLRNQTPMLMHTFQVAHRDDHEVPSGPHATGGV